MSGNKAMMYRIPTKSELEYANKPRGKITGTHVLTDDIVYKAMSEIAKTHPNFFNLSTTAALNEVEKYLEKDHGWKGIRTSGNSITGPGDGGGNVTYYVKKARNNKGFVLRRKQG